GLATVSFVCETVQKPPPPGVRIVPCAPDAQGQSGRPYFFSRYFEADARAMLGAAFPDVPSVGMFELFHDQHGEGTGRAEYPPGPDNRLRSPLRNATQLLELQLCSAGYVPTPYQKTTFPELFHPKLQVL